jgi:hypothetical protein
MVEIMRLKRGEVDADHDARAAAQAADATSLPDRGGC